MTKYFRGWWMKVDALVREGRGIPPFQLSSTTLAESPVIKAVCSFETNQVIHLSAVMLLLIHTTNPTRPTDDDDDDDDDDVRSL